MHVEALILRNFQGHADLRIQFAPDVTTIIGPSDIGKSAVLRALRWVCLNEGALNDILKHEAANVRVALKIAEEKHSFKITRERGAVGNIYTLDGKPLKAFGNDVPENIKKILQVNATNFQSQFEPHFWFSLSAPEVSRRLNAVVDLSLIDEALANMAQTVYEAKTRHTVCGERVKEIEQGLKDAEAQKDRIAEFDTLEEIYADTKEFETTISHLAELLTKIRAADYRERQQQATEGGKLLHLASALLDLEREEEELSNLLHDAQARAAVKPPPNFEPVAESIQNWKLCVQDCEDLSALLSEIGASRVTALFSEAKRLEKEFHKQIEGKLCPICQRQLPSRS